MADRENLAGILARIQKLRALTQSNNPHEAAAAAAKVEELLQKHQLSEIDLGLDANSRTEDTIQDPDPIVSWTGNVPTWERLLCQTLVRQYDCASYLDQRRDARRVVNHMRILGRRDDIALVRYQFAYFRLEIQRLASQHKGKGKAWMTSYRWGAVAGIRDALHASKKTILSTAPSTTAMVLLDRLAAAKALLDTVPGLKTVSFGRLSDPEGYHAGKKAGAGIHQGKHLAGGVKALPAKGQAS